MLALCALPKCARDANRSGGRRGELPRRPRRHGRWMVSSESAPRALEVQVRSAADAVVVTVHGEIDMASAPHLQSALDEALRDAPAAVVVDMSNVGFLGSAGLSVLLAASEA